MLPVSSFDGAFRFLSNFYPAPVSLDGVVYPTVEHAYQAAKTLDQSWRVSVRACRTPGEAKRCGKLVPMRSDWDGVKLHVMQSLLLQKFAPGSPLCRQLIATRERELIEGNAWGDTYWGVCRGEGANNLGQLLMAIREQSV